MKDVVVWSKPSCVQCSAVKRTLAKYGVEYDEKDLSLPEHAEQLEQFRDAGFIQAPVVTIGGVPRFAGFEVNVMEDIFS